MHTPRYADAALPKSFLEVYEKIHKLVKCNFLKVASGNQLFELEKRWLLICKAIQKGFKPSNQRR